MQKWTLKEIIENAKNNSPFYGELYKNLPSLDLKDLPIIDQAIFWKSEVLTDEPTGIVFKSGGSTGSPKFSYFTHQEWISFTEAFGRGMSEGILSDGDRVANLFYAGDMYASFIFIKDSLQAITKKKIAQFPITGQTDHLQILKTLEEFSINVIVGVPSAILSMLEKYTQNKSKFPNLHLEKILFGGEALYDDQRASLLRIFPELKISSIGCASVDGGLIGYSSEDCANGEHRVFDSENIIELVDPDTLEVITECGRAGKVLLTNLTRKLMPIIRYPAGDMAMWCENEGAPNRKFKLIGRSDEAARLGTLSVYFDDTRAMISDLFADASGLQIQFVLKHFHNKDELTIKVALLDNSADLNGEKKIYERFVKEKPVYLDLLKKELIHPLKVEFASLDGLEMNKRTGKIKRIIDRRNE